MSTDPVYRSEVLEDLTSRRKSLNRRMANIDSAMQGICSLVDAGGIRQEPVVAANTAKSEEPNEQQTREKPVAVPATQGRLNIDRRRKPSKLNVYVNPVPEWRRMMASVKADTREQTGIRCPKCGSCDTREALSGGFSDVLLFFFDFINARCRSCNTRFRVWRTFNTAEQHAARDLQEFSNKID